MERKRSIPACKREAPLLLCNCFAHSGYPGCAPACMKSDGLWKFLFCRQYKTVVLQKDM